MRRTDKLPELLAPAGSFEHLKAVIKAGADAVYMGGQQFGARAYADNLSRDNLEDALYYAHFYERSLYLTVNTLVKEKEMQESLYDFLRPYYERGLDGVIVQDIGAAAFIRERFPGLDIHGSTQMTITDVYGARAAARCGMNRIVPARELSLSELEYIKKDTGLELEVFIHGALCYCYSGQCLLSSMYGGRSGNRGRCAQPCRLPYKVWGEDGKELLPKGSHILSPKDLCTISRLKDLIWAGADSLKIEGRMKNIEYAAGVTAIYRKYLDEYKKDLFRYKEGIEDKVKDLKIRREDEMALEELYSRSGFTDGYGKRHNGAEMMSIIHPRNLGRKIGQVESVLHHEIAFSLQKGEKLHPKDILIIPVEDREIALTVPGTWKRKGALLLLNVPSVKNLKKGAAIYRRKNIELSEQINRDILQKEMKYPVFGKITVKIGQPVCLNLSCRNEKITLFGEIAQTSSNRPVTKEDVLRQIKKTGQIPFYWEDLQVELDDGAFVPMSRLKSLRQDGFGKLQKQLEERRKRTIEAGKENISLQSFEKSDTVISLNNKPNKLAVVYDEQTLQICLSYDFFDGICLPADFWKKDRLFTAAEEICSSGKKVYFSMPQIFRSGHTNAEHVSHKSGAYPANAGKEGVNYAEIADICLFASWSGIFCHNIGEAQFLYSLKGSTASVIADAELYQWNRYAIKETAKLFGTDTIMLPAELSRKECETLLFSESPVQFACTVYGRMPVMRSAQCIKKTMGKCNHRQEILWLEDKEKRKLPVVTHCDSCFNTIWLDEPRNLIGEDMGRLKDNLSTYCFHFFLDTLQEISKVIREFEQWETAGFSRCKKNKADDYWNYGIK